MDDVNQRRLNWKKEGYALLRYDDGPIHSYPYDTPWLTDEGFASIYNRIRSTHWWTGRGVTHSTCS